MKGMAGAGAAGLVAAALGVLPGTSPALAAGVDGWRSGAPHAATSASATPQAFRAVARAGRASREEGDFAEWRCPRRAPWKTGASSECCTGSDSSVFLAPWNVHPTSISRSRRRAGTAVALTAGASLRQSWS